MIEFTGLHGKERVTDRGRSRTSELLTLLETTTSDNLVVPDLTGPGVIHKSNGRKVEERQERTKAYVSLKEEGR